MANHPEGTGHNIKVRGRTTKFNSIKKYCDLAFGKITREEYERSSSKEEVKYFEAEIDPSTLEL